MYCPFSRKKCLEKECRLWTPFYAQDKKEFEFDCVYNWIPKFMLELKGSVKGGKAGE